MHNHYCAFLFRAQEELHRLESQSNDSLKSLHDPVPYFKAESSSLEGVAEEGEVGEEGLERLQEEVDELQEIFDQAVIDKHSLAVTCQELAEKLKSANHLLER